MEKEPISFIYNQQPDFMLTLSQRFQVKAKQVINIYLRIHNGNGYCITIEKTATLMELIQNINNTNFELPELFSIVFRGKHLSDVTESLNNYEVTNNSILHIVTAEPVIYRNTRIDISVYFQNQKFIVSCVQSDRIVQLKKKICILTKISPKDQILVFQSVKLQNQKTLSHYKIKNDSLICLLSQKNCKETDEDSDCHEIEIFGTRNNDIILSSTQLCQKTSRISKTTIFRSESLDRKNIPQVPIFEVQINSELSEEDSFINHKQFNFNLFQKPSITQNDEDIYNVLKMNHQLFSRRSIFGSNIDEIQINNMIQITTDI